jgi:hypothetical protein
MSTVLDVRTVFNPQPKSKFFAAPAEIRYEIYAYLLPEQMHLSLCEKGFRLLPCAQRDKDDDPDCFGQRTNNANLLTNPLADPIYALRLRSSWGSHWRCEETAIQLQNNRETKYNNITMALFLVCKQM